MCASPVRGTCLTCAPLSLCLACASDVHPLPGRTHAGGPESLGFQPHACLDDAWHLRSTCACPLGCAHAGGPESLGNSRRNLADEHVSIFSHMHYRSGVWWLLELAMDLESMQLGVYLHHGSPLEAVTHVVVEVGGQKRRCSCMHAH